MTTPDSGEWQWGVRLAPVTLAGLGTFAAVDFWCDDEEHARSRASRPGTTVIRRRVGPTEEVTDAV